MLDWILAVLLGAVLLIQIVLLAKSRKPEVPMGVLFQLEQLDRVAKELQSSVSRLEGGFGAITGQIQKVAETSGANSLEPVRQTLDQKFAAMTAEARTGRVELSSAFKYLESRLEQRLSSVDTLLPSLNKLQGGIDAVAVQFQTVSQATAGGLEPLRDTLDQKLVQVVAESRAGRGELVEALQQFESRLEQRLGGFDAMTAANRQELSDTLVGLREELTKAVGYIAVESTKSRDTLTENAGRFEDRIRERFMALTSTNQQVFDSLKADIGAQLAVMSSSVREQLDGSSNHVRNQLLFTQELLNRQMSALVESSQQSAEQLRGTLNERLATIQADNIAKLDEIRHTVDEKLHATLEQRLGESFQLVCDRLEQVHRGLGEMHALTAGVGDLKRVLSDVRTTGAWGEVQLGAIIEQILAPEQYARNVTTRPGNHACVDFALRLPGIQHEQPVWLPIDARFPMEDYQRFLDAVKRADDDGIRLAAQVLEERVRNEAQALFDQHVCPPYTTDFAILYLPTEGLYAEVLRRPGLSEAMQRDYRVVLAGPTNLSAILNSLQMGFKTLTIEKRSAEVWSLLGEVKSEFGRFGDVLAATQEKLEAATNQFSEVNVRTRAIQQRLQRVEELPKPDMARVLSLVEPKLAVGDGVEA
jgi:DNA recombination protein RmuC